MFRRWPYAVAAFLISMILVSVRLPIQPSVAQDGDQDDACETLLTEALQIVGSACAEIGQNEACYGHFPVTSQLQTDASGQFEADGDLIDIPQLQSLVTEPADPESGAWGIALLLVEADSQSSASVPITFVLFGDVELNSQDSVASDPLTCSITNSANQNINLRATPSTDAEIVGTLSAEETAVVDARNESSDWLRIQQGDSPAWVYAPLITADCNISTLGVPDENGDVVSSGSTPAFSLETGHAAACNTLPDGLLVRSPEGRRARVVINGVDLVFSSVGFLTAQPNQDLTLDVLEGQVEVTADGQTETVTANMSTTVPLNGLTPSGPPSSPQSSDEQSSLVIPALTDATAMLDESGIGNPACAVSTDSAVNLRGGPGTDYALAGQFDLDTEIGVSGTATGTDGAQWWQLDSGSWVRANLVAASGRCEDIPSVEPPAPPPTSQPNVPSVGGRRMVAIDPYSNQAAPLLTIEMGCFEGSAPGIIIPVGTMGYVTGDPQCNRYPVTFDTGQSGWLLADYVEFLE